MKYNIEIDDEDLVPQILKEDYLSLKKEIELLVNIGVNNLEAFQLQDMQDCTRWLNAIATLLMYYLPLTEAEQFLEDNA